MKSVLFFAEDLVCLNLTESVTAAASRGWGKSDVLMDGFQLWSRAERFDDVAPFFFKTASSTEAQLASVFGRSALQRWFLLRQATLKNPLRPSDC